MLSNESEILVVDDIEDNRYTLERRLKRDGYENITLVDGGAAALELISERQFDLILLDLMMPEMDGFEFAENLRTNKKWLDIPVVVITAKDLTSEEHSKLKGNVEAIMQKGSYSKDELLSEIGRRIKTLKRE